MEPWGREKNPMLTLDEFTPSDMDYKYFLGLGVDQLYIYIDRYSISISKCLTTQGSQIQRQVLQDGVLRAFRGGSRRSFFRRVRDGHWTDGLNIDQYSQYKYIYIQEALALDSQLIYIYIKM